MKDSPKFVPNAMWQITVSFKSHLSEEEKNQDLDKAAEMMSKDSPIVDKRIQGDKGQVVIYRPDCIPKKITKL